ncbi:autotransporter domain-containing protein [Achromobacter denitrificans]|uniref:autotransporter domain-containing protein n=1 Tax=Achromobacter denitrificans TaxID=32002 RepID=UPI003CFEDEE1
MNHIYRVIFNRRLGIWQVASEKTRSHSRSGRARQRLVRAALAAGAALAGPALSQTYSGADEAHGPFSSGSQTFLEQSRLEADTEFAVAGGQQTFRDESQLNALSRNAVSDGEQHFFDQASLAAREGDAITGGEQRFNDQSRLEVRASNAISGGTQHFLGASELIAGATRSIVGGVQIFSENSKLWLNAQDAFVAPGYDYPAPPPSLSFKDDSTLNITHARAARINTLDFSDRSVLNMDAAEGITGTSWLHNADYIRPPTLNFRDSSTFNANSSRGIAGPFSNYWGDPWPAAELNFHGNSVANANAENAFGDEVKLSFHDDSTLYANTKSAYVISKGIDNQFNDRSRLVLAAEGSLSAPRKVQGGTVHARGLSFKGNSVLDANADRALDGSPGDEASGWLSFYDDSVMNINGRDVLRDDGYGWSLRFLGNSTLNVNAEQAATTSVFAYLTLGGNSTLNANVANAIRGSLALCGPNGAGGCLGQGPHGATLNANTAQAINGGRLYVYAGQVNAQAADAVSAGYLRLAQEGVLNANAAGSVSGGELHLGHQGAVRIGAENALTDNVAIQFGYQPAGNNTDYYTGGSLNLNGHSTTVGRIQELRLRPLLNNDGRYIQNTGAADAVLTIDGNKLGDSYFSGEIRDGGPGSLRLVKTGASTLTLDGASGHSGGTLVRQGKLVVGSEAGSDAALTHDVTVESGATVAGHGRLGATTILAGGILAPGGAGGGGLTVTDRLTLASGSVLDAALSAPGGSGASVDVRGDLILEGATVNVRDAGGFGAGLYRLFDYTGTLERRGDALKLGATPAGSQVALQYLDGARQINLVNTAGMTLNFWNANGAASATQAGGGSGVWSNTAAIWTDANGSVTSVMQPQPGFAIFAGDSGTVTISGVDGPVRSAGLQFASSGYTLDGDALTLVADAVHPAPVEIRVGDGSAASTGYTATLHNVIAGQDGLHKTGAGTLVLTANNTYQGMTRISAGTLSVSADGALGAADNALHFNGGALGTTADMNIARNIVLDGAGAFDTAAGTRLTLSGPIGGAGGLLKTGAGVLSLTRANNYQGGTTVRAGTLAVDATGALGQGPVRVDGATLNFNADSSAQSLRIINRNGGTTQFLAQASAGEARLHNEAGGTLVFADRASAARATLVNGDGGRILLRDQASADAAAIHNAKGGTLDLSGLRAPGIAIGALESAGDVLLGGATLTLGGLGMDNWIAGVIADGGEAGGAGGSLVKTGTGTLMLSGVNTYTGSTTVQQGTLLVSSASRVAGPVSVASGATLGGEGTVGSTTVAAGGILAPDYMDRQTGQQGTGTLRVAGDLTLEAGSTYRIGTSAHYGDAGRVEVTGTATLLGGSVLHASAGFKPNYDYTILTAGNGVNGTFEKVTSNFAYLAPSLVYAPQSVKLRFEQNQSFAALAQTPNQRAVANALDSLPADHPLRERILTLPNGAPPEAFKNLSGEAHASLGASLQNTVASARATPLARLRGNLSAPLLPGAATASSGMSDAGGPASALPSSSAQPVWAEFQGSRQTLDGGNGVAGSRQTQYGLSMGADYAVGSGWRLGAALTFSDGNISASELASKTRVNSYGALLYGGKAFDAGSGKLNLLVGGGYTWHDLGSERSIHVAGLNEKLKADYGASTAQLFAELGYAMPLDGATLEPFAGIAWSDTRTRGFSESGGSAALSGKRKRDDLANTSLGLRAQAPVSLGTAEGTVRASVGWRHALGSVQTRSTLAFDGGQPFTVAGTPIARNAALLELGGEASISRNASLGLGYSGQLSSGAREHTGTVNMRWRF